MDHYLGKAMNVPKVTKPMKAVDANLTITHCCEPNCGMTILLDKEEAAQGRLNRCTACVMKAKLRGGFVG